jgi:hypothetical protein
MLIELGVAVATNRNYKNDNVNDNDDDKACDNNDDGNDDAASNQDVDSLLVLFLVESEQMIMRRGVRQVAGSFFGCFCFWWWRQ